MKTTCKTTWKNTVGIRDYIVDKAIAKNEDLEIVHDKKSMTLSPEELKKGFKGDLFKSKYTGETYRLVYFTWRPDK